MPFVASNGSLIFILAVLPSVFRESLQCDNLRQTLLSVFKSRAYTKKNLVFGGRKSELNLSVWGIITVFMIINSRDVKNLFFNLWFYYDISTHSFCGVLLITAAVFWKRIQLLHTTNRPTVTFAWLISRLAVFFRPILASLC